MQNQNKVQVRIQASQQIRYDQTIWVTVKEANELKEAQDAAEDGGFAEEAALADIVDGFLDKSDIEWADDLDDVNVVFI